MSRAYFIRTRPIDNSPGAVEALRAEVLAPFGGGAGSDRSERERRRKLADRSATRGRTCRWCQATDAETHWSSKADQCAACEVARRRRKCPTCDGPRAVRYCIRCGAPSYLVPVVLLDKGSDRERTVYRGASTRRDGSSSRRITIASRQILVTDDPLVIELPTERWLRTRA